MPVVVAVSDAFADKETMAVVDLEVTAGAVVLVIDMADMVEFMPFDLSPDSCAMV